MATKSSDLLSKWYGESEQQVSRLFARARQVAPTVIFIDEIDSLAPVRGGGLGEPAVTERVVNTILAEMDGLEELQGVVVMAARTAQPGRPGPPAAGPLRRADLCARARRQGTAAHPRHPHQGHAARRDVDLDDVRGAHERFTGADLEDLTRRAGLLALRENLEAQTVTRPISSRP